jgi:hypothetical protein
MDEKARAATLDLIEQLKREHLNDSLEQLFKRYQDRQRGDSVKREAAMRGALLLDELVRESKEVPPGLSKRPH